MSPQPLVHEYDAQPKGRGRNASFRNQAAKRVRAPDSPYAGNDALTHLHIELRPNQGGSSLRPPGTDER